MPKAVAGFHDDEVKAEWERRQRRPVRECTSVSEREAGTVQTGALAPIDGLLRQAIVAASAPANLDDDEGGWRPRIDRHQVELRAADPHAGTEHLPAKPLEVAGNPRLRIVAQALGAGPHPASLAMVVHPAVACGSISDHLAPTRPSPDDHPRFTP
jgi:hypothetical protein